MRVYNECKFEDAMCAKIAIQLYDEERREELWLELANPRDRPERGSTLIWNVAADFVHEPDPTSSDALDAARVWLADCSSVHECCAARITAPVPRRVLEISDTSIFLREGVEPPYQRYACLSHCWGPQGPALRLTNQTKLELKKGVRINTLPRTFQEAAIVCLRLGISYLWIDALCIYQDNLVDWEETAGSMADIYEYAYVTIAATCAKGSDDGLRPLVSSQFQAKLISTTGMYVQQFYHDIFERLNPRKDSVRWPLLSRGWVFQERLLSPRILYFSIYRLIWECKASQQAENENDPSMRGARSTNEGMKYFGLLAEDPVSSWHRTVAEFCDLVLTYDSDKLPAIAALASKMSLVRKQDTYLCGLWRNSLLHDLRWFTNDQKPPCKSGAPTWSWASVNGRIQYEWVAKDFANVKLLDVEYIPVGSVYMGRSTRARITLTSTVIKLKRRPGYGFELYDRHDLGIETAMHNDVDVGNGASQESPKEVLIGLFLGTYTKHGAGYCGMILKKSHDCNVFERIGWMRLFNSDPNNRGYIGLDFDERLDAYLAKLPIETVTIM